MRCDGIQTRFWMWKPRATGMQSGVPLPLEGFCSLWRKPSCHRTLKSLQSPISVDTPSIGGSVSCKRSVRCDSCNVSGSRSSPFAYPTRASVTNDQTPDRVVLRIGSGRTFAGERAEPGRPDGCDDARKSRNARWLARSRAKEHSGGHGRSRLCARNSRCPRRRAPHPKRCMSTPKACKLPSRRH
jgi:hypothetical protein